MKKKIIFITIESAKREVDSKILFALKALKKNFRVVIGHKGALSEMTKDTNPGIIILKSFGPRNTQYIDFIKKKNFKIVSSDEECITAIDFEDKLDLRINNINLKKINLYLAVGETSDIPVIKKNFNFMMKNVIVCGNMRLELLKEKYRKIYENESDLIKNKFGNYFLLLTAFPRINTVQLKPQLDFIYHRIIEKNIDPDSYSVNLANESVIMQREILYQTLKFLNNFEKNFPDKNLIISPHPNEIFDFWKNFIDKRKFKNIFINPNRIYSTNALINSAEISISSNSTAILEVFFLNKKIINLLGKNENIAEINLLKKISKVVRSAGELIDGIKELEKIDYKKPIISELKEIKNFDKNFDSYDSVLDSLEKLENVDSYDDLFKNSYYRIISKLRMLKNYVKKVISFKLELKPRIMHLYKNKIGNALTKKNFIKNLERISSVEKIDNLIIKEIAPEVFLIDTNNKY
jgi:surface carbohydrate biosynthesis protein